MMKSITNILSLLLLALIFAIAGTAFWYKLPFSDLLKTVILIGWALFYLSITICEFTNYRKWSRAAVLSALLVSLCWWLSIHPSNERIWADDVARTVNGTVSDNIATLYNVRNFRWRSLTDYDPSWETRNYDLSKLSSVDLFLSSWGNPDIAHTLVSFGFSNGDFVTFSVEIRKEKHEAFSEIAGFFKQYEIAMIAADENDIIKTRTNIRKEDVLLYRVLLSPSQRKELFLSYIERGNRLAETPVFYNTITANCTTVVFDMVRLIVPSLPMDYRILLSGRLPSYIYDIGGFGHALSFDELATHALVTPLAQKAGNDDDFSQFIRKSIIQ